MVLVGAVGEPLLDEAVAAGMRRMTVEHARVGDPAPRQLLVHHALALARRARLEARLTLTASGACLPSSTRRGFAGGGP